MKRSQAYSAEGITVTFDPNLCIHSAVCLASLPAVFDVGRRRWIRPEAASIEEVARVVGRCPSGALRYALEGNAEAVAEEPKEPAGTSIEASRNGPLLVEGAFELYDENGERIVRTGRAALCRCGGTANAPFCDGTHKRNGFTSKPRAAD